MPEIGSYQAKTLFSKLLARVKKGERFIITVHGHPVAELVPLKSLDREKRRKAIEEMTAFREQLRATGFSLKDVLKPGETLRELAHRGHHR